MNPAGPPGTRQIRRGNPHGVNPVRRRSDRLNQGPSQESFQDLEDDKHYHQRYLGSFKHPVGSRNPNISHHINVNRPFRRRLSGNTAENNSSDFVKVVKKPPFLHKSKDIPYKLKVGYKRLSDLLQNSDANDVLAYLTENLKYIDQLLADRPDYDIIVMILKLLVKVKQANYIHSMIKIYSLLCKPNFLEHLTSIISKLMIDKDSESHKAFYDGLTFWFESVVDLMPTTAVEHLIPVINLTITALKGYNNKIFESEVVKLTALNDALELKKLDEKGSKTPAKMKQLQYQCPPDDFHSLPVIPTAQDLRNKPFLRPAIIEGSYIDAEHYLDVQYRLLREDFVDPLRKGIQVYKENCFKSGKKFNPHLKIYLNVQFVGIDRKSKGEKLSFFVSLDSKKKINWGRSKRLLFGSLVLFSADNFGSFIVGTVSNRDLNLLEIKNTFSVSLRDDVKFEHIFGNNFIMAESSTFFEPYFQVLTCIKTLPTTNLPMENYLLAKKCESKLPGYISRAEMIILEGIEIPRVGGDFVWPGNLPCMNESQFEAFKAAFQNEFITIQGPPGTGKTYVGLKIVSNLLVNFEEFDIDSPIIIVCFTNHALDQFLEGLLSFTKEIIRIGGQCKNEKLLQFNLNNARSFSSNNKSCFREFFSLKQNIADIHSMIHSISKNEGIINFLKYPSVIDLKKYFRDPCNFLQWLFRDVNFNFHTFISELDVLRRNYDSFFSAPELLNVTAFNASSGFEFLNAGRDVIDWSLDCEEEPKYIEKNVEFILQFDGIEKWIRSTERIIDFIAEQVKFSNGLERKNYIQQQLKAARVLNHLHGTQAAIVDFFSKVPNMPSESLMTKLESDVWNLSRHDMKTLYHYWKDKLLEELGSHLAELNERCSTLSQRVNEIRSMETYSYVKQQNPKIVGLTTSGAGRVHTLLEALKPKIVVVEEAAEVLEAHVVVSLTRSCEHLILIGDHQQLKPSAGSFHLAMRYNIEVSLFERMLLNGVGCHQLSVQHRMRPEIASLIVPLIYPNLQNHPSVSNFPDVMGTTKNLFFLDHSCPELEMEDNESHSNPFEADFLIHLCRYLILQGYLSSEITILTTYLGQQFHLLSLRKQHPLLKDVRITAVDNFQGEENRIILLSLVRSNAEGKIGFLATKNRICVALSRAKEGLFIVGNMTNLAASSETWKNINDTLKSLNAIGKSIVLKCQIHGILTEVSRTEDFELVKEGGCLNKCLRLLKCGHSCKALCHITDLDEHKSFYCTEPCERAICTVEGHSCPDLCGKICNPCQVEVYKKLLCRHWALTKCCNSPEDFNCRVDVQDIKPDCGHKITRECYRDIHEVRCSFRCDTRLACGHACTLYCHPNKDPDHTEYKCLKDCERKNLNCSENHKCQKRCHEECGDCTYLVEKKYPCGHLHKMQCCFGPNEVPCSRRCNRRLPCGHKCPLTCGEACTTDCQEKVKKIIPGCNHSIKIACYKTPTRADCKAKCARKAPCGHPCLLKCRDDCSTLVCQELCDLPSLLACGHKGVVVCHRLTTGGFDLSDDDLLRFCKEPCGQLLPCNDVCSGTCGECMQGRIHKPCQSQCGATLICGHVCNSPCRDTCPPCTYDCRFVCEHSKCKSKCGVPCKECKEKCGWQCKHLKCSMTCGELCDRMPCYEPCDEILKCGHPCCGFCGEPCPILCNICDNEQLTEIFFGTEDEEGARFVMLKDCQHVFESSGLETYMNTDGNDGSKEISIKVCPRCKTPIINTLRFSNSVKTVFSKIIKIKNKIFGSSKIIDGILQEIQVRGKEIKEMVPRVPGFVHKFLQSDFCGRLNQFNRDQHSGQKGKRKRLFSTPFLEVWLFRVKVLKQLMESSSKLMKAEKVTVVPKLNSRLQPFSARKQVPQREIVKFLEIALFQDLRLKIEKRFLWICRLLNQENLKLNSLIAEQFEKEVLRFVALSQLFALLGNNNSENISTSSVELKEKIETRLFSTKSYSKDEDNYIGFLLENLSESLKSWYVPLTAEERQSIHSAMSTDFHSGMRQGHWFECSNGHPYCIADCGGAMVTSKCPECGEVIGGRNHTLVGTSRLNRDMDGASHPAWSNQQNMLNYRFN